MGLMLFLVWTYQIGYGGLGYQCKTNMSMKFHSWDPGFSENHGLDGGAVKSMKNLSIFHGKLLDYQKGDIIWYLIWFYMIPSYVP